MPTESRAETQVPENRLLAALKPAAHQRLVARTDLLSLAAHEEIYRPSKPINHVYFPLTGVLSVVARMEDGRAVEIAAIGSEGMVGLPLFLGATTSDDEVFCQVPGQVRRMTTAAFVNETAPGGSLHAIVERYARDLFAMVGQSVACNGLHGVNERCARWLLLTCDRAGSNEFPLTHEFLGLMLGVRRASVTVAAGTLQKAGFITYRHGRVAILDRKGLEGASCECYRVVRKIFDRPFA